MIEREYNKNRIVHINVSSIRLLIIVHLKRNPLFVSRMLEARASNALIVRCRGRRESDAIIKKCCRY